MLTVIGPRGRVGPPILSDWFKAATASSSSQLAVGRTNSKSFNRLRTRLAKLTLAAAKSGARLVIVDARCHESSPTARKDDILNMRALVEIIAARLVYAAALARRRGRRL